jgi:hypothetical protein
MADNIKMMLEKFSRMNQKDPGPMRWAMIFVGSVLTPSPVLRSNQVPVDWKTFWPVSCRKI